MGNEATNLLRSLQARSAPVPLRLGAAALRFDLPDPLPHASAVVSASILTLLYSLSQPSRYAGQGSSNSFLRILCSYLDILTRLDELIKQYQTVRYKRSLPASIYRGRGEVLAKHIRRIALKILVAVASSADRTFDPSDLIEEATAADWDNPVESCQGAHGLSNRPRAIADGSTWRWQCRRSWSGSGNGNGNGS